MDDGALAELDALRTRAYGPDADIAGDPQAAGRLAELEAQDRRERAVARAQATGGGVDTGPVDAAAGRPATEGRGVSGRSAPADDGGAVSDAAFAGSTSAASAEDEGSLPRETAASTSPAAPSRPRWLVPAAILVVVGVIAAAGALWSGRSAEEVVEAPAAAVSPAPASVSELVERIEIEGPLGNSLAVPLAQSWPEFTDDEVDWASSLGERFGWELWVAGVASDPTRFCLVLERHGNTRTQCAGASAATRGMLRLTLPNTEIAVARQLDGVDRIEFRWTADGAITLTSFTGPPERGPRSTDP